MQCFWACCGRSGLSVHVETILFAKSRLPAVSRTFSRPAGVACASNNSTTWTSEVALWIGAVRARCAKTSTAGRRESIRRHRRPSNRGVTLASRNSASDVDEQSRVRIFGGRGRHPSNGLLFHERATSVTSMKLCSDAGNIGTRGQCQEMLELLCRRRCGNAKRVPEHNFTVQPRRTPPWVVDMIRSRADEFRCDGGKPDTRHKAPHRRSGGEMCWIRPRSRICENHGSRERDKSRNGPLAHTYEGIRTNK